MKSRIFIGFGREIETNKSGSRAPIELIAHVQTQIHGIPNLDFGRSAAKATGPTFVRFGRVAIVRPDKSSKRKEEK